MPVGEPIVKGKWEIKDYEWVFVPDEGSTIGGQNAV
jgi:hypothetical protein